MVGMRGDGLKLPSVPLCPPQGRTTYHMERNSDVCTFIQITSVIIILVGYEVYQELALLQRFIFV